MIWVLGEDWVGNRGNDPFRWFPDLDAALVWIEANPPQQYQDFILTGISEDGLPAQNYNEAGRTGPTIFFPGDPHMKIDGWHRGLPYPVVNDDRHGYRLWDKDRDFTLV